MYRFLKQKGFTFVETVLAIVVVSVVAGVAAKVLLSGLDVYGLIVNRHDVSQNVRLAMERMVDEIVLIETGDITWMANTRFSFRDIDNIGTNFKRDTVSKNGSTVACIKRDDDYLGYLGMTSAGGYFDFDYLKDDGTSTIWFWQLRRINIDVRVDGVGGAGSIRLRTNVYPRNFMYSNFE
ncbi:MAG: prepilin-type N-terminal cleavage/methylation domain-containing protein [Deltaproteobacteria bacterium]|nr:prepilin-type N-terminal cleavage/methylation domain-containing protein [Deltaproteobacteria bacterium]